MRKWLGCLIVLLFLVGAIHALQRKSIYEITTTLDPKPVRIYSVNPPKIIEKEFSPKDPMKSFLLFELSGDFEGNLGYKNDVAFELEYMAESKFLDQTCNLYLKAMRTDPKFLLLTEGAHPLYARRVPFKSTMKVAIMMWGKDMKAMNWMYKIKSGREYTVKVLNVKFDTRTGWALNLSNP